VYKRMKWKNYKSLGSKVFNFVVAYTGGNFSDETLSSSALLKNLLSEPIKSWRNYSSCDSTKTDQSKEIPRDDTPEDAILTPGVLTKPPLPKKSELSRVGKNESQLREDPGVNAIHDYLTLKYESSLEKERDKDEQEENKIEKTPSDDSAINLITLDDVDRKKNESIDDVQKLHIQNWMEEKCEGSAEWEDPKRVPNLSDLDIDDLFKDESDKKFDHFFRSVEEKSPKKKPKASPKPRVKFIATPIKADPDCDEKSTKEVETWMAKKPESGDKKSNYLDFLTNIDELENSVSLSAVDISQDLPQHDVDAVLNSPTFDDIASILKVLEAEDKKSRIFFCYGVVILVNNNFAEQKMESMKQLLDSEISSKPHPLVAKDCKTGNISCKLTNNHS
jgi:hypothetical protein